MQSSKKSLSPPFLHSSFVLSVGHLGQPQIRCGSICGQNIALLVPQLFAIVVLIVNGGKFRVKTEGEQQIWNECSRLISNAVIYYNTLLLSRVYEQKQAVDDQAALAIIKDISPVAWQHINLFGTFEFSPSTSKVDIEALVVRYADPTYWYKAIQDEVESNIG
jgi:Tn3 transposase DDE domain